MIYLSQSSIADFLVCSQRYKYRIYNSESADKPLGDSKQNVGTVVHKILEHAWKQRDVSYIHSIERMFEIEEPSSLKSVDVCLNNFYRTITPLLSDKDEIEFSFKIKFEKDVYIVGRMDRITEDGIIFDWKTSNAVPDSIDKNIQFILYHWAYKKIYKKNPKKIFLAALARNKLVEFNVNKQYYDELIEGVIPSLIKEVKNQIFYREGIYKGACNTCAFSKICLEEGRT